MGLFWSRPAATQPIVLNEQAIVSNLTEDNLTRMWASRTTWEGEQLYLVQDQGISDITPPCTWAVKKFQSIEDNVKYRYKSEMIMLASNSHDNIIKVVDLIEREFAIMLIYVYPVNGSLQSWLHQPMVAVRQLSWPRRKFIADGVAQGLCHLHHGCNKPVVHHNISSYNILLDQNFRAVIAGFGAVQMNMSGLGQPLPITGMPPGNFGYAAPEYGIAADELTEKVDTYSFGVVLLELVTGRVANGAGADGQLAIWAQDNYNDLMANHLERFRTAIDEGISDQAKYLHEMASVFRLAVDCTVRDPRERPSMRIARKRLRCRGGRFDGLLTCY